MSRFSIAAVVGCLYVAGAVWLVRSEGEAHRAALRRARGEAPPAPASASATPVGPVAAAPPSTEAKAPPPRPAPEASPEPGVPVVATAVPEPEAVAPSPAGPAVRRNERPRPSPGEGPPATPPPDPWDDLAHLSADDEIRLGRELQEVVLTYNRRLDTGPWLRRAVELLRPLAATCSRKEIPYTVTILDSDAVTAFSHPGGYLYLCRGLFDLIGEDEGYALEFVLAHEVAHVDLRHALRALEKGHAADKQRGLSTSAQFYLLIACGYPEAFEFEADAWAYERMRGLDRTRRESLAFLRKFQGFAQSRGFENGRLLPPQKSDAPAVENHFRAHPAAWDRLGRLSALNPRPASPAATAPPR